MFKRRSKPGQIPGNSQQPRSRAIVIGGSFAGLLAARVLSEHYKEVLILERDELEDGAVSRKGQQHTVHTHVLLAKGLQVLKKLFPSIEIDLKKGGAEIVDFTEKARWHVAGGKAKQHWGNLPYVLASRPFLEHLLRTYVSDLPGVSLQGNCKIQGLTSNKNGDRILGVEIKSRHSGQAAECLRADLVLDATGRGSQATKWLTNLGYEPPSEDKIDIDVGYATRVYCRKSTRIKDGKLICVIPSGPREKRGGCIVPMENDRWICTLAGWGGDHPTDSKEGFISYAKSISSQEIGTMLEELTPLSDIKTYKYRASLRRRYDKMKHHPLGFLVLGDAMCSFNPIFGQGMTSACCQAMMLGEALKNETNESMIWKRYYRDSATYIDRAWLTAAIGDYQFPSTRGHRPFGVGLLNLYTKLIHRTSHSDSYVYRRFIRVTNLLDSPASLLHWRVATRVLYSCFYDQMCKLRIAFTKLSHAN